MKTSLTAPLGIALALVWLHPASALHAQSPQYYVLDLGTLGGTSSQANDINNSGQVTGDAYTSGGRSHAFLYSGGSMTDLGTLGGSDSSGLGINNFGQVAGFSFISSGGEHAFLYSGGSLSDLGAAGTTGYGINDSGQVTGISSSGDAFLYSSGSLSHLGTLDGGFLSFGFGINNSGQVAGRSQTVNGDIRPFLYSGGSMIDLGTFGGPEGAATSINDSGQVTGYSFTGISDDSGHAFLYSSGSMSDLGTLGGGSAGLGINNSGQVAGAFNTNTSSGDHAFLYSGGSMKDLNSLATPDSGWTLSSAQGINDRSQIVGYGTAPNGQRHAFLLKLVSYGAQFSGGLGDLPGGTFFSEALGISNGGTVAAGGSTNGNGTRHDGFRWTPGGGMVGLNTNNSSIGTEMNDVTPDGSIIVGRKADGTTAALPVYQVNGGAIQTLPLLAGTVSGGGVASGVSDDGSVIVGGLVANGLQRAVRWVNAGAAQDLGFLPGASYAAADRVSGDGNVVIGDGRSSNTVGSGVEAFRWTQGGGMVGLGDLAGGVFDSHGLGVSRDGAVIVGFGTSANGAEAFRWTQGGGMVSLGDFAHAGATNSSARGVNGAGDVIVGYGTDTGGQKAMLWDARHGMRNLQSVLLSEYGVDYTGWTLRTAYDISAAGDAVAGSGTDPLGNTQAFIAQVNSRTYRYLSGETYSGFHTSHLGGFGTGVDVLGGTAGGAASTYKTLTIATKAAGAAIAPAAFGFASDIAVVSGIDGDTFVMELSYDEAMATALFGSEAAARLGWYNAATLQWENAVSGDTGGTASFAGDRAYNPGTDTLGSFGVDTANNEVWAVVNHNSEFGVTAGVPEPTCAVLLLGGGALLALRRRRSPAGA